MIYDKVGLFIRDAFVEYGSYYVEDMTPGNIILDHDSIPPLRISYKSVGGDSLAIHLIDSEGNVVHHAVLSNEAMDLYMEKGDTLAFVERVLGIESFRESVGQFVVSPEDKKPSRIHIILKPNLKDPYPENRDVGEFSEEEYPPSLQDIVVPVGTKMRVVSDEWVTLPGKGQERQVVLDTIGAFKVESTLVGNITGTRIYLGSVTLHLPDGRTHWKVGGLKRPPDPSQGTFDFYSSKSSRR